MGWYSPAGTSIDNRNDAVAKVPISTEITGTVCQILVSLGDSVRQGQEVMILESMKMEIPMTSHVAGLVDAIEVSEGDAVTEGSTALIIEVE